MSYLKIENMEIAFTSVKGKFVAVKDINLEVEKGQIISIIGHSGCGKSTIMNAIGGMVFPSKGNVILNGKEIKGPGLIVELFFKTIHCFHGLQSIKIFFKLWMQR